MTRHLQFRVENDVYEACEAAAESRGMSLNAYGAEMVAAWVKKAKGEPPVKAIPRKYQPCVDMLTDILTGGDPKRIKALVVVLESLSARSGKA